MSDCYRDDGTGTEDWGVTRITEQVAAWEPIPAMGAPNRAMLYYRLRTTAEALRKDAERIDWLQHHATAARWGRGNAVVWECKEIRAAIDAAKERT